MPGKNPAAYDDGHLTVIKLVIQSRMRYIDERLVNRVRILSLKHHELLTVTQPLRRVSVL